MDSLAQLFEIIVLSATGVSIAALVGFIVWDSIVDRRSASKPAAANTVRSDGVRLASGMTQAYTAGAQSATAKAA